MGTGIAGATARSSIRFGWRIGGERVWRTVSGCFRAHVYARRGPVEWGSRRRPMRGAKSKKGEYLLFRAVRWL